jgi:hypothetical protein
MSFFVPDTPIGSSYQDFGGAGPGIFSGSNGSSSSSRGGGRNKFREALMAASKYKSETDYKAEKESKEKEKRAAQRNTMKIDDNTSVMEGYTDPGFTLQGQKGRSLLGTVGAVVTPFAPLTGQAIGAVGNLTGY